MWTTPSTAGAEVARVVRIAMIVGGSPIHGTRRVFSTLAVGLHRVLTLPVTLPLARLVEELNAFQPDAWVPTPRCPCCWRT